MLFAFGLLNNMNYYKMASEWFGVLGGLQYIQRKWLSVGLTSLSHKTNMRETENTQRGVKTFKSTNNFCRLARAHTIKSTPSALIVWILSIRWGAPWKNYLSSDAACIHGCKQSFWVLEHKTPVSPSYRSLAKHLKSEDMTSGYFLLWITSGYSEPAQLIV